MKIQSLTCIKGQPSFGAHISREAVNKTVKNLNTDQAVLKILHSKNLKWKQPFFSKILKYYLQIRYAHHPKLGKIKISTLGSANKNFHFSRLIIGDHSWSCMGETGKLPWLVRKIVGNENWSRLIDKNKINYYKLNGQLFIVYLRKKKLIW